MADQPSISGQDCANKDVPKSSSQANNDGLSASSSGSVEPAGKLKYFCAWQPSLELKCACERFNREFVILPISWCESYSFGNYFRLFGEIKNT